MTSNPLGPCCVIGVKHDGEPRGQIRKIGNGITPPNLKSPRIRPVYSKRTVIFWSCDKVNKELVEAYVSYPANRSTSRAILVLSDVIGHEFVNSQLIADELAGNGFFVVMPDLFHGDPIPLNRPAEFNFMAWLKGPPGHLPNIVDPVVHSVLTDMRGSLQCQRIGLVGYCFGAKYAVRFLKPGFGDVGYVAHPSFVEAVELKDIKGPLSIAAAETDSIFPASKRHESEEILARTSQPYQINLFSGVEHGFAVRADIYKSHARFAKESAFCQAVAWFNQHL